MEGSIMTEQQKHFNLSKAVFLGKGFLEGFSKMAYEHQMNPDQIKELYSNLLEQCKVIAGCINADIFTNSDVLSLLNKLPEGHQLMKMDTGMYCVCRLTKDNAITFHIMPLRAPKPDPLAALLDFFAAKEVPA